MIVSNPKIILIGHGDVVCSQVINGLVFQNIKTPKPCGVSAFKEQSSIDVFGTPIYLRFDTCEQLYEFNNQLASVESGEIDCIHYGGWKIKFAHDNKTSIEVVRSHFNAVMHRVIGCQYSDVNSVTVTTYGDMQ